MALMIAALLAADAIGVGGPRTSFVIGVIGMAAIVLRTASAWWFFMRLKPEERQALRDETLYPPGPRLGRWASTVLFLIGWLGVISLTVLALGATE
jgi:hypothetical protein